MTLKIIRPAWPDDDLVAVQGMLTAINVPETVPLWTVGGTYAIGDRVRRDTTHRIYEAGAASTGKVPEENLTGTPASWIEVQATNRYSIFDAVNNTVTSNPTSIDFTMVPGRFNALYLGGLEAASVDVTVTAGGDVLYTRHVDLVKDNVFSWLDWLNEPIILDADLVLADIPVYNGATLRVVINQPSGTAKCGTVVVGLSREIGQVKSGAGFRLKSNSSYKEKGFGIVSLTKRPAARRVTAQVYVPNEMFDEVNRLMMEYDGVNLVWAFSDVYRSLTCFGYKSDFDNAIGTSDGNFCNLDIMGLI